ncbi:ribonuclease H-like domain-containing protein [Tanacetum coccineum]
MFWFRRLLLIGSPSLVLWPIHQLDVKNAFLNGDLSKTVYMHQPPGFVDSRYPKSFMSIHTTMYGLNRHQFVLRHAKRFACYMPLGLVYSPSLCDSSLFKYNTGFSDIAHIYYILDDIILTASSLVLLQQIETHCIKIFTI